MVGSRSGYRSEPHGIAIDSVQGKRRKRDGNDNHDTCCRTDEQHPYSDDGRCDITAESSIDLAHCLQFDHIKTSRNRGKDVACLRLLEIAQRDALQHVTDIKPGGSTLLVADAFLHAVLCELCNGAHNHARSDNAKRHPGDG